jgi:hypothetical protein
MSPEAQRIAIAEACGWTDISFEEGEDVDFDARSVCPWAGMRGMCPVRKERRFLPSYLNDLNAMHEAEKELTDTEHSTFRIVLMDLANLDFRCQVSASAAQRAEAFLRTIGRWQDAPNV